MPILRITVAPELEPAVRAKSAEAAGQLAALIESHFSPAPGTLQICFQSTIAMPVGHALLAEVLHRATPDRSRGTRNALARDLAGVLHTLFNASVRVRVTAVEQDTLAAADLVETERP
jgi:hypothetical protein